MSTDIVVHQPDDTATPTLFGISLNRLVAFGGPYLAVASGAIADWLLVHVHVLSLFHTTHNTLAGAISQASVFALTTLVVWLGHQKWLDGFQKWAYQNAAVAVTDFDGPLALPEGHDQPFVEHTESATPEAQSAGFKSSAARQGDPSVPPGMKEK